MGKKGSKKAKSDEIVVLRQRSTELSTALAKAQSQNQLLAAEKKDWISQVTSLEKKLAASDETLKGVRSTTSAEIDQLHEQIGILQKQNEDLGSRLFDNNFDLVNTDNELQLVKSLWEEAIDFMKQRGVPEERLPKSPVELMERYAQVLSRLAKYEPPVQSRPGTTSSPAREEGNSEPADEYAHLDI